MVIKNILTILLKGIEYSDYYKDPMEVKLADIEQKIYFEEQLKKSGADLGAALNPKVETKKGE